MKMILPCLLLFGFSFAHAQDDAQFLDVLFEKYQKREPVPLSFTPDLAMAMKVQAEFVKRLSEKMGPIVGYKASLTNANAQKKFAVEEPVRGSLLRDMLVPSGTRLPIDFATYPLLEGDLMVRVGDPAINDAKSKEEVLQALDALIPFAELPDLVYQRGRLLNGSAIAAANAGARMGIIGEAIPISGEQDWMAVLPKIRIEILDAKDQLVSYGYAQALLGHPINAVIWLRDSLKGEGIALKKGDLLSLGAITGLVPITNGSSYRIKYFGLSDQPVELTASFGE